VIIADTSGLLAFFNRREPAHAAVAATVGRSPDALVVSPYVIAEIDYLAATRLGTDGELAILRELSSGAYDLPALSASDVARAAHVVDRYRDQSVGVADASLVVLAERYETRTILTLDRRHFGVLRPLSGGRFRILPA
jgi:predicted nucleic acid-binding protein